MTEEEKQRIAKEQDIIRGEALTALYQTKEWQAVAEIAEAFLKKWHNNLLSYDASKPLEEVGREREKWCLMRKGVELLFVEFSDCIDAYQKSVEARKERISEDSIKTTNPYREQE